MLPVLVVTKCGIVMHDVQGNFRERIGTRIPVVLFPTISPKCQWLSGEHLTNDVEEAALDRWPEVQF